MGNGKERETALTSPRPPLPLPRAGAERGKLGAAPGFCLFVVVAGAALRWKREFASESEKNIEHEHIEQRTLNGEWGRKESSPLTSLPVPAPLPRGGSGEGEAGAAPGFVCSVAVAGAALRGKRGNLRTSRRKTSETRKTSNSER